MPAHPKPAAKAKKPGLPIQNRKRAPKVAKAPVVARKPAKAPTPKPEPAAGQTKTDMILGMLKSGGATSKAMEEATGWAAHSVRGLLGTLRKRGIKVVSTKLPGSATVYSIPADAVGDVL